MRLITISRRYGAGGGEVAARLGRALGWELLDHELLHRAAQLEHLPDADLEVLDEQAVGLSDRFRIASEARALHSRSCRGGSPGGPAGKRDSGRPGHAPARGRELRCPQSAAGGPQGLENPADGGDRGP